MNRKEQQLLRQRQTTRQLMGVTRLTEHGAVCGRDELLFYLLRPDNLSILSPEGFASILWKDASRSGEACAVMKLTAQDLRRGGIVQGVLREPEGGAHTDWEATFRTMDAALRKELAALDKLKGPALARQRYEMFRAMGRGLPPAREEEV